MSCMMFFHELYCLSGDPADRAISVEYTCLSPAVTDSLTICETAGDIGEEVAPVPVGHWPVLGLLLLVLW